MRRLTAVVTFLVMGVLVSSAADAQWGRRANRVQGLELFGGGGVNFCVPSETTNCDNLTVSGDILLGVGYRFSHFFGLYLDGNYGWLKGTAGTVNHGTLVVMPTARGFFIPIPGAEFFVGVGVGPSLMDRGDQGVWHSWINLKFNIGGDIRISQNAYLGVNLDYIINWENMGRNCNETSGSTSCVDSTSENIPDLIQTTAFIKFRFN